MSSSTTYTFSKAGRGTLDLEVDAPSKQVYHSGLPEAISCKIGGLESESPTTTASLHFFEWQKIQFTYSVKEDAGFAHPIELCINDRTLKKSQHREDIYLLSGQFSFEDAVGETRLEIKDADKKLIFRLEAEVFPQKMDYRSDYKAMMADISAIIQSLAFDTLKDTFRRSKARLTGHATEHEWWNILDALFELLIVNLGVIKRQPKHEIRTSEKVVPVERVKQASKRSIDWFQKNTQYANQIGKGLKFGNGQYFTHALSCKKYVTYDTYENRFIAWAVKNIIEQLRKYKKYTEANQGNKDYSLLIGRMKSYQSRLQGILHENPFDEVSSFEKRAYFSTSLTRGAGYRDFMHIYLLLSRGLEIAENEIFKIEQKNISTLYEYWCFLMLVKLLKEQNASEINYQDLIKVRLNKISVELAKGKSSKVSFKKAGTEETTTIYFNREFAKTSRKVFTFNQRPDYAIKFKKKGFEKPFWYLFDAKYRFEEQSESDINQFNVPQDAIGQLHRYRDAILHTEPVSSTYRGAIKNLGGIILYPYPKSEDDFKSKNIYYKSIEDVNIGALPFLPSKTYLVSELLNDLINRTPEQHFEQFIEMDRSEYEQNRNLWKEWVTIGVIPSSQQEQRKKFLRDTSIFHFPFVANSNSKLYMSHKLLLCKAGTSEAYLYDVKDWEILTDKELHRLGTTWNHRYNKYVAFHLLNGNKINTPGKIAPLKYRYATGEGLRKYMANTETNKDCFYLTNPDAARLYEELKKQEIYFKVQWDNSTEDPSQVIFQVGDYRILSSDKFASLHFYFNNKEIQLYDLVGLINR